MPKVKPCPFCGESLLKVKQKIKCGLGDITFYEHPSNDCVLSTNTDEFTYTLPESQIDAWNKRTGNKKFR